MYSFDNRFRCRQILKQHPSCALPLICDTSRENGLCLFILYTALHEEIGAILLPSLHKRVLSLSHHYPVPRTPCSFWFKKEESSELMFVPGVCKIPILKVSLGPNTQSINCQPPSSSAYQKSPWTIQLSAPSLHLPAPLFLNEFEQSRC